MYRIILCLIITFHVYAADGPETALTLGHIKQDTVNNQNEAGETALYIAVKEIATIDSIKKLLELGADLHTETKQGDTPYKFATKLKEDFDRDYPLFKNRYCPADEVARGNQLRRITLLFYITDLTRQGKHVPEKLEFMLQDI